MGRHKGSKNKSPSRAGMTCVDGHNQRRSMRKAGLMPPFEINTTLEEAINIAGIKS